MNFSLNKDPRELTHDAKLRISSSLLSEEIQYTDFIYHAFLSKMSFVVNVSTEAEKLFQVKGGLNGTINRGIILSEVIVFFISSNFVIRATMGPTIPAVRKTKARSPRGKCSTFNFRQTI